jgi:cytochrome c oxidase subunit 1
VAIAKLLQRPVYPTGIWGWITTIDHKRIGILYGVTAFIFFIIGGIEAFLMRLQLSQANLDVISPEVYNQLFTMHGTTMIFLAIMPLGAAFFNFVIPLQIGARDVAFPRLNAFSYWTFLFGGIFLNTSWIFDGAPNAGWFGYANITSAEFNPGHGITFWAMGLQILGIASLAAAFNFIVTIINMRAPGMSLMRLPVFTWMTLITSFLLVLAFPVITVALIELIFDRLYGTNFFVTAAGGDPLLWQHLFWVFGHPEVYILILPAMGIVSEVLPTSSRKPLFGYPVIIFSGIVIAFMGWAVWSHHMFTVGLGPIANSVFAVTTMAIAVPTGVKIFNWIATMWRGSVQLTAAMLFSIGFIAMFIIGGLSGVMHSAAPSDAQQQDTYFVVAHIHYVLFGGSIFAIFSGIYYWFPKMTGKLLDEKLGKIHFFLTFLGMNITFFPMHFLGLGGMPRRIYTYDSGQGFEFWNLVATFGAVILALSVLSFLHNFAKSVKKGEKAGDDPWDGRTLEWSISSPPPEYNFAEIPHVTKRDEFWHMKRRAKKLSNDGEITEGEAGNVDVGSIHMPSPSYYPLLVSVGIVIVSYGILYNLGLVVVGGLLGILSIYGWSFEPATEPSDEH